MKKSLTLFSLLIYSFLLAETNQFVAWDSVMLRTYGGINVEESKDVKETHDRHFVIAGTSSSFGQGNTSVYIVNTDSLGNKVWSKNFGGINNDHGQSLEITPENNVFFCGYSNSFNIQNGYDAYYGLCDSNGNLIWEKTTGGNDWDFIYNSIIMPDSGYVLCGETFSYSNGGSDAWLLRLNKIGDTLWTNHFGGNGDELFRDVELISNRLFAVGKTSTNASKGSDTYMVKTDLSGNLIKDTSFSASDSTEDYLNCITNKNNTSFYVGGTSDSLLLSNNHYLLLQQLDTNFALLRTDLYQNTVFRCVNDIVLTSDSAYTFTCLRKDGFGKDEIQFFRFSKNDFYMGGPSFGSSGDEELYSGIRTSDNKMVFTGYTNSYGCGGKDILTLFFKHDSIHANNGTTPYYSHVMTFCDTLSFSPIYVHNLYEESTDINAYPNPFTNQVNLFSVNHYLSFEMYNLLGERIDFEVNNSNGFYTFSIEGKDKVLFLKVKKESDCLKTIKLLRE